ncbi:DUF2617 family protein [Mycobacterium uberis]|uniref:DUF2617 family protein n=1 Tax=Mycobacterium uberis TaxID=2162698 RepID=UPI003C783B96
MEVLNASHVATIEHSSCHFSEQISRTVSSSVNDLPEYADTAGYLLHIPHRYARGRDVLLARTRTRTANRVA